MQERSRRSPPRHDTHFLRSAGPVLRRLQSAVGHLIFNEIVPAGRTIKADYLKPVIEKFRVEGRPFKMGMVSPVSTHNYELRYWLAAAGLHPGYYGPNDVSGQIAADVLLSVMPPPQMPAALKTGTINGDCVGEPWNQQAVLEDVGVPVIADYEIWKNSPEKVFGLRAAFIERYP